MDPRNPLNYANFFEDESQQTAFSSQFPQNSSQYNPYAAGYPLPPFQPYLPNPHQGFVQPSNNPIPTVVEAGQGSKCKRPKAPAVRRPSWNPTEDLFLCQAWLRVSEDPCIGSDQQRSTLWERIRAEFIALNGATERNANGLMNRWSTIQAAITKFNGYFRSIERLQVSGRNESETLAAAKEMYLTNEQKEFKLEVCWNLVKDTSKWYDHEKANQAKHKKTAAKRRAEINLEHAWVDDSPATEHVPDTPSTGINTPTTPSTAGNTPSTDGNDAPGLERPPGRKASKKSRSRNTGEGGDLFMEQFRHMRVEDRDYYSQVEADRLARLEEMRREELDRKIQIREKELQARLREQEFRRIKEKNKEERRVQKIELQRKELEMKIMFTNLDNVDDEDTRRWVLRERRKISKRIEEEEADSDGHDYLDD